MVLESGGGLGSAPQPKSQFARFSHAKLIVAALLLSATPARPAPSNGLPTELRPSLPVFGSGKVVNFSDDSQAMTNAAAHVGFSLAIPLLGERIWGRKGLWATGLS